MSTIMVPVPDAVLFHRQLGKSAKLLWIVLQQVSGGNVTAVPRTGLLQARSGLARHTVLRALAQLRAGGWVPAPGQAKSGQAKSGQGAAGQGAAGQGAAGQGAAGQAKAGQAKAGQAGAGQAGAGQAKAGQAGAGQAGAGQATAGQAGALVPADLLPDRRIGVQAKLLYACLQRIAGSSLQGECTYTDLSAQAGISANTVKRAVRALQAAGWVEFSQHNKFCPIQFWLGNPVARRRDAAVAQVDRRYRAAAHKGEALMRAYLSLIVDSDEHDDDASPAFLVNPFTGEEMQFDRYYPPGVAFEFNGPQHYGPTEQYPDEIEAIKQQARDHIKKLICAARGIHLVVVHADDLTLERMRQQVAGHLPLRRLAGHGAVTAYLEEKAQAYRNKAREGRARSA